MQNITKIYSDIDLSFRPTPGKKDIALSVDDMAVVRSIRHLLLTKFFERPFQPTLGSQLESLLFEPLSPLTASSIKSEIESTIKNYEPRVNLISVNVSEMYDNNAYNVTLTFFISNKTQPQQINLVLERTR